VQTLIDRVAGKPMLFCNNASLAGDGTVYSSDSSRRFGIDHWRADLFEHSGTGRLLRATRAALSTSCWTGWSSPTGSPCLRTGRSSWSRRPARTGCAGSG